MNQAIKIATVVGARPQFVKAAVVSQALKRAGVFEELIVHTGQHYDDNLSEIFFAELGIPLPAYHLGVGSGSHAVQTAKMLEGIEDVLIRENPQIVLTYGDTNSTLAGVLAAAKLRIPVAHVEAGLRSHNRDMPEEINRIVADHVSGLLFAPTAGAVAQLQKEGVLPTAICLVGDVMYDAALSYGKRSDAVSRIIERLSLGHSEYALCTVHRAENTDNESRLRAICAVLTDVSRKLPVILPLHPRTLNALKRIGMDPSMGGGIRLIPPAGYLDMIALQKKAAVVITDSGGVQKEAFFHRVPCVTLRNETEWPELVDLGWNRLADLSDVAGSTRTILDSIGRCGIQNAEPYGQGDAAEKIVRILVQRMGVRSPALN
jgi:UDP-GlcNAc3NAcA epimerase